MFKSLPHSIVAVLRFMTKGPSVKAVVEFYEQEQVFETNLHPETMVSLLMKRKKAAFAETLSHFHDNGRIHTAIPRGRSSMSMNRSQLNKKQRLLMNGAMLLLLITPEKQKEVLKMTEVAASSTFLE